MEHTKKLKCKTLQINQLPNEVTSVILRFLDGRTLMNATRVCKRWENTCKSDCILRKTIQQQKWKQRRMRWCRAKYGDGVYDKYYIKGSKEAILKHKIRVSQYRCLLALIGLRNMWEKYYYLLLSHNG